MKVQKFNASSNRVLWETIFENQSTFRIVTNSGEVFEVSDEKDGVEFRTPEGRLFLSPNFSNSVTIKTK